MSKATTKQMDTEIVHQGKQIILPAEPRPMTTDQAIEALQMKRQQEEHVVVVVENIRGYPLDAAYAVSLAIKDMFGFSEKVTRQTFFGPEPPPFFNVPIDAHGNIVEVFYGQFRIPGIEGTFDLGASGSMTLTLSAEVKQKHRSTVKEIAARARAFLRTHSLYRGKAIKLSYSPNRKGDMTVDPPEFIPEYTGVEPRLNKNLQETVDACVFGPVLYTEQCRANGIKLRRGCLFYGPYGCLSGETMISINRAGNGKQIRIEDLVRRYNGEDTRYTWDPNIPTFIQREVDGIVRLARVSGAWCSGVKETFTLTTENGRTIRATAQHPFLTESGWKKLSELSPGDILHVRGSQATTGRVSAPVYEFASARHHPYRDSQGKAPVHRMVAEAAINGLEYPNFLELVRAGYTEDLKFLDPSIYAVHHKDHDEKNNACDNLEVMTHREHQVLHAMNGTMNNVLYKVALEKVESITPYGEEMTYDISVEDEPHNFMADGFVVHNTGKSLVMRKLADACVANGWTYIYCKTPQCIMEAFEFARALGTRTVVVCEDFDIIVQKNDQNELQNLLDGVDSKNLEIILVLTTNHADQIPPALMRDGRIDVAVPFVAPDAETVVQLIKDFAGTRLAKDQDLAKAGKALQGQIPAVIHGVVETATLHALRLTKGQDPAITTEAILGAAADKQAHINMINREAPRKVSAFEQFGDVIGNYVALGLVRAMKIVPSGTENWGWGNVDGQAKKAVVAMSEQNRIAPVEK